MVLRLRPAGRTGPASLPRTDLLHERPPKIVASQCAFGRTYGKFQIAMLSLAARTFVAYATKIGRTRSKPSSFLTRVGESEVHRPCLVPVSLSRSQAQDWPESRRSESATGGAALARAVLLADTDSPAAERRHETGAEDGGTLRTRTADTKTSRQIGTTRIADRRNNNPALPASAPIT